MKIYEELQARGLIAQVTDEEEVRELINGGAKFYIGFDPTADSLHVGHFMALCEQMEKWDSSRNEEKKRILVYSLTELIHGREEAERAAKQG